MSESDQLITIGYFGEGKERVKAKVQNMLQGYSKKKEILFSLIPETELMIAISSLESVSLSHVKSIDSVYEISKIESGAPVITVLNSILLDAKMKGASDIHLERGMETIHIRLRIDGVLQGSRIFNREMGEALSVRIKLMANLNTLETRRPQDGRFSITAGGNDYDIRVSIITSIDGESIVLRFLDTHETVISLDTLGFSPSVYHLIEDISSRPQGLVLITGPTGSGKTTTLAALIRNCDPEKRKIISIEDPVEYRISGVTQIQTNESISLGFSVLLKRILRQDPDVIMVGEIRDTETAELSIRAALTGHLVFATVHTRSARETEARLIDMGIPSFLIHTVLYAVINQRLIRRTCLMCNGKGCQNCNDSGFSGRLPLAEVYFPGQSKSRAKEQTLQTEAIEIIKKGLSTRSEIIRVLGESI